MDRAVTYQGIAISRQQILDRMVWYDRTYPSNDYHEPPTIKTWLENEAYKYAVVHEGKLYPPKYILHLITGLSLQGEGLHGGQVNRVYRQHGFEVRRLSR